MICTRSMQLTVKKATRTFKTLEGQLLAMKGGERTTISTRCAELDKQMPLYLGVSKAVLDYVIFCHQEDSLWPLSEPTVLKKRFDEIFEALKYTKALDSIKTLRKDYAVDIKMQQQTSQHLKSDKERADKAETRANQLISDIDRYKEDAKVLKQEMAKVTSESEALFSFNQQFQQVLSELERQRHEHGIALDNIKRISNNLDPLQEDFSDEELIKSIENFEAKSLEYVQKKEDLDDLLQIENVELDNCRRLHNQAILSEGKYQAEAKANQDLTVKRSKLLESASLRIKEMNLGYSLSSSSSFISDMQDIESKLRLELEKVQNDWNHEQNRFNQAIQGLSVQKVREEQRRISSKETIRQNGKEIVELQEFLDSNIVDDNVILQENSILKDLNLRLKEQQHSLDDLNFTETLAKFQSDLEGLERKIDKTNSEIAVSAQRADFRAKLAVLRTNLSNKQLGLQTLIDSNTEPFINLTGEAFINPSTADSVLREKVSLAQMQSSHVSEELDNFKSEKTKLQTRISLLQSNLQDQTEEMNRLESEILQILGADSYLEDYETTVDQLEENMRIAAQNLEQSSFTVKYYEAAVALAKTGSHKCLLCQRGFKEEGEIQNFLTHITKITSSLPSSKQEAEQTLTEIEQDLKSARDIGPSVLRCRELRDTSLNLLQQEISRLKDRDLERAEVKVEELAEEMSEIKEKLAGLERLRRGVTEINRYNREIGMLSDEIQDLDAGVENSSGSEDLHAMLSKYQEQSRAVQRQISSMVDQRDNLRNGISKTQSRISEKQQEISEYERSINDRTVKMGQISQMKQQVAESKQIVQEADIELERLQPILADQNKLMNDAKVRASVKEKSISDNLSQVHNVMMELQSINEAIDGYNNSGGERRLQESHENVISLEQQIHTRETAIDKLRHDVKLQENTLLDLHGQERNLRDHAELRRLQKEVKTIEDRIVELESKHAERDRDRYQEDSERLQHKYTRLSAEYAGKMGEVKQMDDQLRTIKEELETEFANVKEDYRKSVIMLQTTSVANEDLAKYSKAMDNAIMKYHSLKMEEINRIIDELWKKTYSGSDVDTILIRSDNENSKGNRTYNYRVCMVKQDVELDMRGRCSAGQKVLASIIIRLALSECFGLNCGLIALDEPTTNLDSDNIEGLAKSLAAIIQSRRSQKNFQLIVITHDEKFLSHMNAADYADHFFRVSRDDRQKSRIEWVPISRVMV